MTIDNRPAPADAPEIKVLVVDDDRGVRELLRIMLELDGFTVLEADNGTDGVSLASRHEPDFVVLDYMMPGLDGEETGCRIRELVPDAVLLAFSAGLIGPPYWADLFLPKGRIGDLPEMLLGERTEPHASCGPDYCAAG